MKRIIFDSSSRRFVLGAFDKAVDSEGFVVEKSNPTKKVMTPDGEELLLDAFAGIKKGSEIYIKKDIVSLVRLAGDLV